MVEAILEDAAREQSPKGASISSESIDETVSLFSLKDWKLAKKAFSNILQEVQKLHERHGYERISVTGEYETHIRLLLLNRFVLSKTYTDVKREEVQIDDYSRRLVPYLVKATKENMKYFILKN